MNRLYQSLLGDDDELDEIFKKATTPFILDGVEKIWVSGPLEPTNKDIPIMMEFLDYIDWNKIKKDSLYIKYKDFPGPVYNGFTKEYREKINIIANLLCRIINDNNFDVFKAKIKMEKYFLSNYKSKYNMSITFFNPQNSYSTRQIGLRLKEKDSYTKGIEIIFNK